MKTFARKLLVSLRACCEYGRPHHQVQSFGEITSVPENTTLTTKCNTSNASLMMISVPILGLFLFCYSRQGRAAFSNCELHPTKKKKPNENGFFYSL